MVKTPCRPVVQYIKRVMLTAGAAVSISSFTEVEAREADYHGFRDPVGLAASSDGTFYVSNWSDDTVQKVDRDGNTETVLSGIRSPAGLAIDKAGYLFIASYSDNTIVRIAGDGRQTVVADGLATPTGIAFSRDGRLLIANRSSGEIVALDPSSKQLSTIASGLSLPVGVVEMPDGSIVVSQYGGRVTHIKQGRHIELGRAFERPGVGIISDGPDAVLVIDNGANAVRRVAFDGQTSIVVDGLSGSVVALTRDQDNNILIGTWGNGSVYRVRPPK